MNSSLKPLTVRACGDSYDLDMLQFVIFVVCSFSVAWCPEKKEVRRLS